MNKHALYHRPKSEMCYAYDTKTIHIYLKSSKLDDLKVHLIYGDPFEWDHKNGKSNWKHENTEMKTKYVDNLHKYFFISISPKYKRLKYLFLIQEKEEKFIFSTNGISSFKSFDDFNNYNVYKFFNYPFLSQDDLLKPPAWSKNMVWYHIFPDRFYTDRPNLSWDTNPIFNNQQFGGTIKGIIKKIPYLKDLGIQGIYINPIFEAYSMHKYDTINYFRIDQHFGNNEDFKNFVEEAHKNNIKVMLDGVFNHCGYFHPFFQDVILNGFKSKYKNCFYINKFPVDNFELNPDKSPKYFNGTPLNYSTFGFTPSMPKWNTSNSIVEDHLLSAVKYWIEEYNIDGWRLDVSNEISHDFLRKIRSETKKVKKDFFILGENWDSSTPWLLGDQLDSVMNYDLSFPIWDFIENKISSNEFVYQINSYLSRTPKNFISSMFNVTSSHDTIRIKKRVNDNPKLTKIAYILSFVCGGSPSIYYGDEVGLSGFDDPNNRLPMIWDENRRDIDMLIFMKKLIAIYKNYELISYYDFEIYSKKNMIILEKKLNKDKVLIIINNSNNSYNYDIKTKNYKVLMQSDQNKIDPYGYFIGVKDETNNT